MSPDDPRHGSYAGANAHWAANEQPCDACRAAATKYHKRRKLRALRGELHLLPARGAQRRLQALVALGYGYAHLGRELGKSREEVRKIVGTTKYQTLTPKTHRRIAKVYDRLSMTIPQPTTSAERRASTLAKNIAARNGWVPPLMWDDIDNDDGPNVAHKFYKKDFTLDEIAVQRVLDGDGKIARHLTPAEREEVVRRWAGSLAELERLTGWNAQRYTRSDAA